MQVKEKIKELFAMLPRAEQLELVRELTSSTELHNPVVEVSTLSQQQYGKNVLFSVNNTGTDGNPIICATLQTPWGTFEAEAINQKIARVKAAELAILSLPGNNGVVNNE